MGQINKSCFLSLEQISTYCGIPVERVNNWATNRKLKVSVNKGYEGQVHVDDLIDFLVRHNMPIPDPIIPVKVKKILFVFTKDLVMDEIVLKFLMKFLERLKQEANLIIDYCTYDSTARMKLLVFKPDLIILDASSLEESRKLCCLIKGSGEFEGTKVAAIVESSKINAGLEQTLCADALLPRCVEIKTMMERITAIFDAV